MSAAVPRYPVFVPTRGRVDRQLTARMLDRDGVPFRLVAEVEEVDRLAATWGRERVLTLPRSGQGLVYSRNWIKDFATAEGHARHWQFDDDVRRMVRLHMGLRVTCPANVALASTEDFVDRYENVALASFNSMFFFPTKAGTCQSRFDPFNLNHRCYTDFLISNAIPNRWRGRYNEDTDMSLQVLSGGHCTVLVNAFLIDTPATLTMSGGQMTSPSGSYQGDGRLRMARELERRWPFIVTTKRRFQRPQHFVRNDWAKFDTPLRLRSDALPVREYGMDLVAVKSIESAELRSIVEKL